jgi:hypothetical protein
VDPEGVLLCQLWQQLADVQQQFGNTTVISAAVTSISCPYRYKCFNYFTIQNKHGGYKCFFFNFLPF